MTTKQDLIRWFTEGVNKDGKYSHMVIMCDTFDYSDYPIYTNSPQDYVYRSGENMQKVMEVYDLRQAMNPQIYNGIAWNI